MAQILAISLPLNVKVLGCVRSKSTYHSTISSWTNTRIVFDEHQLIEHKQQSKPHALWLSGHISSAHYMLPVCIRWSGDTKLFKCENKF